MNVHELINIVGSVELHDEVFVHHVIEGWDRKLERSIVCGSVFAHRISVPVFLNVGKMWKTLFLGETQKVELDRKD